MNYLSAVKRSFALALLLSLSLFNSNFSSFGQGAFATVNFNNRVPTAGITAPIYDLIVGGSLLSGSSFLAQLYAGPAGTAEDKLTPVGAVVPFRSDIAGFVNVGSSGTRSIAGIVPGSTAVIQIRAWTAATGATYEEALTNSNSRVGKSVPVNITTTSSLLDPIPAPLSGLQSFAITAVPEPDLVWFGTVGLIFLTLKMRYGKETRDLA